MRDQADKLRKIIDNIRMKNNATIQQEVNSKTKKMSRVIAVTSGKGGVGKTNITVNLAIALSNLGNRVAILDADFGLANIDVILGMIPKHTLVDVIRNKKNILEVLSEGPNKIKFISGGSGVEELAKLNQHQLLTFIKNISLLDRLTDVILIDTAAGISDNVMSFLMASDEVILVTTPEPTSITDAYALIKLIAAKEKNKKINVLVNRAESVSEAADIFQKLQNVSKRFLAIELHSIGYVFNDDTVSRAVRLQQPFSICFPKSSAAKQIREISQNITSKEETESDTIKGMKQFIHRLVHYISA